MRLVKLGVTALAALALGLPAIDAEAGGRSGRSHSSGSRSHQHHHHHHHGGSRVFIGGAFYYGYPAYYYPYGVPLYAPAPADPYWYYCRAANTYYPYVQNCPGGWERYLPGTPLG
ncbi:MAG TPA: hypothetical protein VM140_02930 [Burkholderiales bacterium]|nr:hypothetical protein [Burkholderiales bacterium]